MITVVAMPDEYLTGADAAVIPCPWGRVVVHSQGGRIMAVELSSQSAPRAPPGPWPAMVAALLQGAAPGAWLELCDWHRCRPFARTVLGVLATTVPFGTTITYAALAARVGHPGAARAVGRVMASNPFPFLVPCHRCVAATGLGGFQGSAGPSVVKQAMLDWERHPTRSTGSGTKGTA